MCGKTYEIDIVLLPVLLPLSPIPEENIEFNLERVVEMKSIFMEHVIGSSWVVISNSIEFIDLCYEFKEKEKAMICSSDFDLDLGVRSQAIVPYGLFPSLEAPNSFLLRKVSMNDRARNLSMPGVSKRVETGIAEFVNKNFETQEFKVGVINVGLIADFVRNCSGRGEDAEDEEMVEEKKRKKGKTGNSHRKILNKCNKLY
jgi:hypothetical protein